MPSLKEYEFLQGIHRVLASQNQQQAVFTASELLTFVQKHAAFLPSVPADYLELLSFLRRLFRKARHFYLIDFEVFQLVKAHANGREELYIAFRLLEAPELEVAA